MSIASCVLDGNCWIKVCSKISTLSLSDRDIWTYGEHEKVCV